MAGFRGDDEALDREIETLEHVARLRLRRLSRELRDLDRDLRELKRERARRKATGEVTVLVSEPSDATADTE